MMVSVVVPALFFIFSDTLIIHSLGIPSIFLFVVYLPIYALFRHLKFRVSDLNGRVALLTYIFIASCAVSAVYNSTLQPLLFGLLAAAYFTFVFNLLPDVVMSLVRAMSVIITFSIFGGLIAVIAYWLSMAPIFSTTTLHFFPFSMLYIDSGFPRMTGFFLEPGQFSFYICATVACRELLNLPRGQSIAIAILGMLTLSLSHLAFLIIYSVHLLLGSNVRKSSRFYLLFGISFVGLGFVSGALDWMYERGINMSSEPEIWQRFVSFTYTLNLLDGGFQEVLFGPEKHLSARTYLEHELLSAESGPTGHIYGENPLTPIIYGGLFASWPYFLMIFFAIQQTIYRKRYSLVLLGISLLALQRPYILEFPYTFVFGLVLSLYLLKSDRSEYRVT